jgi:hypothetical protein
VKEIAMLTIENGNYVRIIDKAPTNMPHVLWSESMNKCFGKIGKVIQQVTKDWYNVDVPLQTTWRFVFHRSWLTFVYLHADIDFSSVNRLTHAEQCPPIVEFADNKIVNMEELLHDVPFVPMPISNERRITWKRQRHVWLQPKDAVKSGTYCFYGEVVLVEKTCKEGDIWGRFSEFQTIKGKTLYVTFHSCIHTEKNIKITDKQILEDVKKPPYITIDFPGSDIPHVTIPYVQGSKLWDIEQLIVSTFKIREYRVLLNGGQTGNLQLFDRDRVTFDMRKDNI